MPKNLCQNTKVKSKTPINLSGKVRTWITLTANGRCYLIIMKSFRHKYTFILSQLTLLQKHAYCAISQCRLKVALCVVCAIANAHFSPTVMCSCLQCIYTYNQPMTRKQVTEVVFDPHVKYLTPCKVCTMDSSKTRGGSHFPSFWEFGASACGGGD